MIAAVLLFVASTILFTPARRAGATTSWTWSMSNVHGGGTAQTVVTDPVNPGFATVGGDSWGIYNTITAGDDWLPAMKGFGIVGQSDVASGDFFFMGTAYSRKFPGRVYALTGRLESPGSGGFGYLSGDSYTVLTRNIHGGESPTTRGT